MKLTYSTGNVIVDEVAEMSFAGNIVPLTWFKTMIGTSGKPMLLAIDLLADIVYWYRPKEIRDEGTGDLIGFQKKFKADLLQRSYRQIEQRFGVTKKQARAALDYLCMLGVIKKHLRDELSPDGIPLHNNMYLELVPEKLKELTYPQITDSVPSGVPPSADEGITVVTYRPKSGDLKGTTNTQNTIEITTKEYNYLINNGKEEMIGIQTYEAIIKENIDYENLNKEYQGLYKGQIDEIVSLMAETIAIRRQSVRIGGVSYPHAVVKSQFLKLNSDHIRYVLDCLKRNTAKVKNIRNYLLTVLYNAPNTIENYYRAEVNYDLNGGL